MVKLDTPMAFKVQRGNDVVELTATPARMESEDRHGFKSSRGMLGVISPGDGLHIDSIVAVNGERTETPEALRTALLAHMGRTFPITLDRGVREEDVMIHPLLAQNEDLKNPDSIGYNVLVVAQGAPQKTIRHNPIGALGAAAYETWDVTTSTLEAIGQMFTGTRSATELGGIIRIGALAGDMAQVGILALISFTALLSINLGLINLFPIPMLDGGHLAFYAVEAIKGGPISEQFQEYAFRLGLAILVGIMLFANLNDIVQLVL
jgi:regulator of sigma E protease